jgi:hypothetical protein
MAEIDAETLKIILARLKDEQIEPVEITQLFDEHIMKLKRLERTPEYISSVRTRAHDRFLGYCLPKGLRYVHEIRAKHIDEFLYLLSSAKSP